MLFSYAEMKHLMGRLVILPFKNGCSSRASVAVGKSPPRTQKSSESSHNVTRNKEKGEECSSKGRTRTKNPFGWPPLSKSDISSGIHRLIKITVKSFTQIFAYKEIEEVTAEMEIGYPTDVKHITHIGLDGTTTTNPVKGWEEFNPPDHVLGLPSISLQQFELAMAAQTQNAGPPRVD